MPTLQLQLGDCVERMSTIETESIGFIISDPPYGLKFMGHDFDNLGEGKRQREWHRRWLIEAHRILKPNGVIKAFGGTRTFHHLAAAMRSVGFRNIRVEPWGYGSGFPKSLDIGKSVDKRAGKTSTDIKFLKSELNRLFSASNLSLHQFNTLCGFEASGYLRGSATWAEVLPPPEKWWKMREILGCDDDLSFAFKHIERVIIGVSPWTNSVNHCVPGLEHQNRVRLLITAPATPAARTWDGWGTNLKPAWEPIVIGEK